MRVAVVGGGASGFFTAIRTKELVPESEVVILEKSGNFLSKVKVSGGGRCNVTNAEPNVIEFSKQYPRGSKQLKELLKRYSSNDVQQWFQERGVKLKTEPDGRVFPASDSSATIIDCFMKTCQSLKIELQTQHAVSDVRPHKDGTWQIETSQGIVCAHKVVLATGGHPSLSQYEFIKKLGHTIIPPIPSLFTFNTEDRHPSHLMGISMPHATVRIVGTTIEQHGPVLITHWGLSGPAVIRLSAWAAEWLQSRGYKFEVMVNWVNMTETQATDQLQHFQKENLKKRIWGNPPFAMPIRLWEYFCEQAAVNTAKIWMELSQREQHKLIERLTKHVIKMKGKTTFKEEFVTCGGVPLDEINLNTMESKVAPGIYVVGELLHIDGVTGGFNFQSAWTTGAVAAIGLANSS